MTFQIALRSRLNTHSFKLLSGAGLCSCLLNVDAIAQESNRGRNQVIERRSDRISSESSSQVSRKRSYPPAYIPFSRRRQPPPYVPNAEFQFSSRNWKDCPSFFQLVDETEDGSLLFSQRRRGEARWGWLAAEFELEKTGPRLAQWSAPMDEPYARCFAIGHLVRVDRRTFDATTSYLHFRISDKQITLILEPARAAQTLGLQDATVIEADVVEGHPVWVWEGHEKGAIRTQSAARDKAEAKRR